MTAIATAPNAGADTPAQLQRERAKCQAHIVKIDARRAELADQRTKLTASLAAARRELAEAHAAGSAGVDKIHARIRQLTDDIEGAASGLQLLDARRATLVKQESALAQSIARAEDAAAAAELRDATAALHAAERALEPASDAARELRAVGIRLQHLSHAQRAAAVANAWAALASLPAVVTSMREEVDEIAKYAAAKDEGA